MFFESIPYDPNHDPNDPNDPNGPPVDSGGGGSVHGGPAPAPPPTTTTGGGGPHNNVDPYAGAYDYNPAFQFTAFPQFHGPRFTPPTMEDAMNEPGYQFRSNQGMDAIQRSAAAKGLLRTGGTLKDLATWNQNFASGEYGNVYNRALNTFGTNYQVQKDEFAPLLAEAQSRANAAIAQWLARYGRGTSVLLHNMGGTGGGASMPDPLKSWDEWDGGIGDIRPPR